MNPESPMNPRDDQEQQLTALLLGELTPEAAEALREAMARDSGLAETHDRLARAIELLREATQVPAETTTTVTAAEPVLTLAADRREKLLATFKTVPLSQPGAASRRSWRWPAISADLWRIAAMGILLLALSGLVWTTFRNRDGNPLGQIARYRFAAQDDSGELLGMDLKMYSGGSKPKERLVEKEDRAKSWFRADPAGTAMEESQVQLSGQSRLGRVISSPNAPTPADPVVTAGEKRFDENGDRPAVRLYARASGVALPATPPAEPPAATAPISGPASSPRAEAAAGANFTVAFGDAVLPPGTAVNGNATVAGRGYGLTAPQTAGAKGASTAIQLPEVMNLANAPTPPAAPPAGPSTAAPAAGAIDALGAATADGTSQATQVGTPVVLMADIADPIPQIRERVLEEARKEQTLAWDSSAPTGQTEQKRSGQPDPSTRGRVAAGNGIANFFSQTAQTTPPPPPSADRKAEGFRGGFGRGDLALFGEGGDSRVTAGQAALWAEQSTQLGDRQPPPAQEPARGVSKPTSELATRNALVANGTANRAGTVMAWSRESTTAANPTPATDFDGDLLVTATAGGVPAAGITPPGAPPTSGKPAEVAGRKELEKDKVADLDRSGFGAGRFGGNSEGVVAQNSLGSGWAGAGNLGGGAGSVGGGGGSGRGPGGPNLVAHGNGPALNTDRNDFFKTGPEPVALDGVKELRGLADATGGNGTIYKNDAANIPLPVPAARGTLADNVEKQLGAARSGVAAKPGAVGGVMVEAWGTIAEGDKGAARVLSPDTADRHVELPQITGMVINGQGGRGGQQGQPADALNTEVPESTRSPVARFRGFKAADSDFSDRQTIQSRTEKRESKFNQAEQLPPVTTPGIAAAPRTDVVQEDFLFRKQVATESPQGLAPAPTGKTQSLAEQNTELLQRAKSVADPASTAAVAAGAVPAAPDQHWAFNVQLDDAVEFAMPAGGQELNRKSKTAIALPDNPYGVYADAPQLNGRASGGYGGGFGGDIGGLSSRYKAQLQAMVPAPPAGAPQVDFTAPGDTKNPKALAQALAEAATTDRENGRLPQSITNAVAALKLDPDNHEAQQNRDLILRRLRSLAAARHVLGHEAPQVDFTTPADTKGPKALAKTLAAAASSDFEKGHLAQSLTNALAALELDPDNGTAKYFRDLVTNRQNARLSARRHPYGVEAPDPAKEQAWIPARPAVSEDKPTTPPPRKPAATPQPEVSTAENATSTFSLNVSDVSFKLAAAALEQGQFPDSSTVRSEEFVNAFDYRDPEPAPGQPVAFAWERSRYPFAHNRDLLRLSVKTAAVGRQAGRPLNLVLLLDNSGSMERADRVRIIQQCLKVLAGQLQPADRVSVVTFSRTARLLADGLSGAQATELAGRVSGLTPEGGTNLEDAMNLAYTTAQRHFLTNGVNRVVLLTDGAANLGDVRPEALKAKVETRRKEGIALDCFGIGWDGYNDDLLESLARNGDGRYGFVNTPEAASTEFAGQLAGALKVAASDVKVQVEFNPKRTTAYRQIGYAKHQLTKQQFRDNTVDAAELAAAEAGNALYVLDVNPQGEGPVATVRVRYKVPGTADYHEHEWAVPYNGNAPALEQAPPTQRLAAVAAAFSEWLVGSPYAAEVAPDRLLPLLRDVPAAFGSNPRPRQLETMIRQARPLGNR